MKKIIKGLLAIAVFFSSILVFGNKVESTKSQDRFISKSENKSQQLVLQHAKDIFEKKDQTLKVAYHYSHRSHYSHYSHRSHYSHYSGW